MAYACLKCTAQGGWLHCKCGLASHFGVPRGSTVGMGGMEGYEGQLLPGRSPAESRRWFRIRDAGGRLLELTVLPMGLSCSVEVMQFVCSAVAGHPGYVRDELVASGVDVACWVDNVRLAGKRDAVTRAVRAVDERAAAAHITWGERGEGTKYAFLGVDWDHERGMVRPSAKTRLGLTEFDESVQAGTCTVEGLEAGMGRLLHAAAVSGATPADHWWTLKVTRRRLNAASRGMLRWQEVAALSPAVRRDIREWARATAQWRTPPVVGDPQWTVFTDASLTGWGAVAVCHATGKIAMSGASWAEEERALHIGSLEARAVERALPLLGDRRGGTVRFLIDNTSVVANLRRGAATAWDTAATVGRVVRKLRALDAAATVAYVASGDNPADAPSRMALSAVDRAETASLVHKFFLSSSPRTFAPLYGHVPSHRKLRA
eukprot:TRINITY_DN859_c1_g1_i5.p1 TRINITY_DN859_c1_g1~~TRINITY_DN859_c1_g1_i5.p1  ORF type:complete len:433 (+),score=19.59 TRINITY_DN859_c1_g1_i5:237-1535(+)